MSAAEIAHSLDGRKAGSGWIARCPAHNDRNPSLSISDTSDSRILVHCHAGCSQVEVISALRHRGLWATDRWGTGKLICSPQGQSKFEYRERENAARTRIALDIWEKSYEWRGTAVERYLESRSLVATDGIHSDAIRFHPALNLNGNTVGAMIALFRDLVTNEPCGIHRTFIDGAGQKIARKMLGRTKQAAIKIDTDENVELALTIGEGIETCIAAWLAGLKPVWALGSANGIAEFPVLAGIETITILGEVDDEGANKRAVKFCSARCIAAGQEVLLVEPLVGGDMNDVWREAMP